MEISEKIAYLKGLMEGLGIGDGTKEGKVLLAVVDVLGDISDSLIDLEDGMELMSGQLDSVDEDLGELQEDFYCSGDDEDFDDDDDFEGELYEVTCPSCSDVICIDEDMLDEGEISCPNCGELLEFDLDGVIDDCDCDCGCGHHD